MADIRIYDAGEQVFDRYTVIFMNSPEQGEFVSDMYACLSMSDRPFHPQGFGQHSSAMPGTHLGKRIRLSDLPKDCQMATLRDLKMGKSEVFPDDYGLTAEQLQDKYSTETSWGQHPGKDYQRAVWQDEVSAGDTSRSYWDWVMSNLEQEFDDFGDVITAGVGDPDDVDEEQVVLARMVP